MQMTPRSPLQYFSSTTVVISHVTAFLRLRDTAALLFVLDKPAGGISFMPTLALVESVLSCSLVTAPRRRHFRRLNRRDSELNRSVRIRALQVIWRDAAQPGRVAATVTMHALLGLHILAQNLPIELKDQQLVILPSPQTYEIAASAYDSVCTLTCRLASTSLGGPQGISVDLALPCKACGEVDCSHLVLRSCPTCEEVCGACSNHAPVCQRCNEAVCLACMLPPSASLLATTDAEGQSADVHDVSEPRNLCTVCGFVCENCAHQMGMSNKFSCQSKSCSRVKENLCDICVGGYEPDSEDEDGGPHVPPLFPCIRCERCDNLSCRDCDAYYMCDACGENNLCIGCTPKVECSQCPRVFHDEQCACDELRECVLCEQTNCHDCDPMEMCCFGDNHCGMSLVICLSCRPGNAFSCPEGHMSCIDCQNGWLERQREYPLQDGEEPPEMQAVKECYHCWIELVAKSQGFSSKLSMVVDFIDEFPFWWHKGGLEKAPVWPDSRTWHILYEF